MLTPSASYDTLPCWDDEDRALVELLPKVEPLLNSVAIAKAFEREDEDESESEQIRIARHKAAARCVRHREVVRRAYHRNKAMLESLRDTVASLEVRRNSLTASRHQSLQPTKRETLARERALLLTQTEALQQEGERLRLLLRNAAGFGPPSSLDDDASELESDGAADPVTDGSHTTPLSRRSKCEWLQCGVSPLTQSQKKKEQSLETLRCRVESTPGQVIASSSTSATRDQIPYMPLTVSVSKVLVSEAYHSILSFSFSETLRASISCVLGWENTRSLEATTSPSFSLRKTFPALDAEEAVDTTWEDLLHATRASQTFSGLLHLRVLQRVSDDVAVALRETPSNVDDVTASRCVLLVFRMRTASGFLVGLRSMTPVSQAHSSINNKKCSHKKGSDVEEEAKDEGEDDPESSTDSASGRWGFHFSWFSFDRAHCSDELEKAKTGGAVRRRGTRVTYSGCGDESEHEAMATLAMNALSLMLRWEAATLAPPFALPSA